MSWAAPSQIFLLGPFDAKAEAVIMVIGLAGRGGAFAIVGPRPSGAIPPVRVAELADALA